MSKILTILFSFLTIFLTPEVHAQTVNDCPVPMRTEPTPIFSDRTKTPDAKFIINVSPNKNSDYQSWKMRFDCGIRQNEAPASIVNGNDTEIFRKLDNTGCEFFAGNHGIQVIAETTNGPVPQCIAKYQVVNSDTQCQLDIYPQTGITSASNLTVSGKNLTKGGQFGVFIDGDLVIDKFVETPDFPSVKVPNSYLTPTSHLISLRKYNIGLSFITDLISQSPNYGSPLCQLIFSVGPPNNPGSVVKDSSGATSKSTTGSPTISSGQTIKGCNDANIPDPNDPTKTIPNPHPGVTTAIGCIHTNPAEFVKDLMTWVIGIGGGLAFLMMLLGAFQMLTSAGNPETLAAGRDRLTSAVIGLLFVIFAILLLQIIGVGILNIPGFK